MRLRCMGKLSTQAYSGAHCGKSRPLPRRSSRPAYSTEKTLFSWALFTPFQRLFILPSAAARTTSATSTMCGQTGASKTRWNRRRRASSVPTKPCRCMIVSWTCTQVLACTSKTACCRLLCSKFDARKTPSCRRCCARRIR